MICSYIIQHFHDTFRQSIIDLMHGNIADYKDVKFDETVKILASIIDTTVDISGYYHYGALNHELQLAESLLKSTRLIKFHSQIVLALFSSVCFSLVFISPQIWLQTLNCDNMFCTK